MAVGDEAKTAVTSYVALSKETTFGTLASQTTAIEALSVTFKTNIDSLKLDTISQTRDFTKRVQLDKVVAGTLEQYLHPEESVLLFASALGGGIVSSSLTSAGTHSLSAGNFDTDAASLSFNVRKGDIVFDYVGARCNSMKITGNVGEVVTVSYEYMMKDSTIGGADLSAALSISSVLPFTYVNGTFRYESTEALAATTTAEEPIQGFELTVNNNLEGGAPSRELGTNLLTVLPAKRREIEFKTTQRFDTTTTFNRFIQATQGSIELFFSGESITAEHNNELTIRMPKVFLNSPEPELGGPDEILSSELEYDILNDDPNTSTGKAIGFTFINATISY